MGGGPLGPTGLRDDEEDGGGRRMGGGTWSLTRVNDAVARGKHLSISASTHWVHFCVTGARGPYRVFACWTPRNGGAQQRIAQLPPYKGEDVRICGYTRLLAQIYLDFYTHTHVLEVEHRSPLNTCMGLFLELYLFGTLLVKLGTLSLIPFFRPCRQTGVGRGRLPSSTTPSRRSLRADAVSEKWH